MPRGKDDQQAVQRMSRVLEELVEHLVSVCEQNTGWLQLAFEMNLSIWIFLCSPGICFLVLIFRSKLIAVFIVTFWVTTKDIAVIPSVLNALLAVQQPNSLTE